MRFKAPEHVTEVHLSVGPVAVVDGFLTLPDDASSGDLAGLSANGFTPEVDSAPVPTPISRPTVATSASDTKED